MVDQYFSNGEDICEGYFGGNVPATLPSISSSVDSSSGWSESESTLGESCCGVREQP